MIEITNSERAAASAYATQVRLVIDFTEPVRADALTDGLGEWMRDVEAGDGFAKLGIRDWHFESEYQSAPGHRTEVIRP